jgi:hypothetical protein
MRVNNLRDCTGVNAYARFSARGLMNRRENSFDGRKRICDRGRQRFRPAIHGRGVLSEPGNLRPYLRAKKHRNREREGSYCHLSKGIQIPVQRATVIYTMSALKQVALSCPSTVAKLLFKSLSTPNQLTPLHSNPTRVTQGHGGGRRGTPAFCE